MAETTIEQAKANMENMKFRMSLEAQRVRDATRRHDAAERDLTECTLRYKAILAEQSQEAARDE
jgi:hypothetical protein